MRSLHLKGVVKTANGEKTVSATDLSSKDLKELLQKIRANHFHFEVIENEFDRKIKLHQVNASVENGNISIELIWDGLSEAEWKEMDEGNLLADWAAWNGFGDWSKHDRHFANGRFELNLTFDVEKYQSRKKPAKKSPVIVEKHFRGIFKALVIPLKNRSDSEDDMALDEFDRHFLQLSKAEQKELIQKINKKDFYLDEVVNIYSKSNYKLQDVTTQVTKSGLMVELVWGAGKGVTRRDLESELSHSLGDAWGLQDHPFAKDKYSFNLSLVRVEELKPTSS